MKKLYSAIFLLLAVISLSSCHHVEEWDNDPKGNFEALWTIMDQHYCFFAEKDVDWQAVHDQYAPFIRDDISSRQLFDVCSQMLDQLKDGHVNLASWFDVSYYRAWWADYPQDYNERLIQEHYLHFKWLSTNGIEYAILPQNVGYMRYASFDRGVGEGNLDVALRYLAYTSGLVIDVRDNPGGSLTHVETLVRRFITQPQRVGYMQHKKGPGHDDFAQPFAYDYAPAGDGHYLWTKPVVLLTNRSTFSAANNFVSIMSHLPNVTIVGARTGGGSGMPMTLELPCGWTVRFSSVRILDALGHSAESGVDPDIAVTQTDEDVLAGRDPILDRAIAELQ